MSFESDAEMLECPNQPLDVVCSAPQSFALVSGASFSDWTRKVKPTSNWQDFWHRHAYYVRDLAACWALCYDEGRQYDVPGLQPVEP